MSPRSVEQALFVRPLHAAIVRSEEAHAAIRSLDPSAALAVPGVRGVFGYEDLRKICVPVLSDVRGIEGARLPPLLPLADGEALFIGDLLAAVVAEDRVSALDAAELVRVDCSALPAASQLERAIAPDAPRAFSSLPDNLALRCEWSGGDLDREFAKAEWKGSFGFSFPGGLPRPLELRSAAAQFDSGTGSLTVHSSGRSPYAVRRAASLALGLPESRVRVLSCPGAGFPGTRAFVRREEILVAALALLFAPRPVLWCESPEEHELAAPRYAAARGEVSIAARKDGRLLAIRCDALVEAGASGHLAGLSPFRPAALFSGPYAFLAAGIRWTGVLTNAPPTDLLALRGGAFFSYVLERAVEETAAALELEPAEVRRINLYRGEEECVGITGVRLEPQRSLAVFEALLERSGAASLRAERRARRERREIVGVGVALPVELCARGSRGGGIPAGSGRREWSSATVRVLESGAIEVLTGIVPRSRGLETALQRIAAQALGVPESEVCVRWGDTFSAPPDSGASPGRSLASAGSAVLRAAKAVEARMRAVAARALRVPEEYVQRWEKDFATEDRAVSYEEVCRRAYAEGDFLGALGLEATCFYDPEGPAVSHGAHLSIVAIDPETGRVRPEKHFAVHDAGILYSREAAEADLKSGALEGISAALEGFSAPAEGTPFARAEALWAAPGFPIASAGLPCEGVSFAEGERRVRPHPELTVLLLESRAPGNPIGVRGIGESAFAGALAATANAVSDALRALGSRPVEIPASPERVWRALPGAPLGASREEAQR